LDPEAPNIADEPLADPFSEPSEFSDLPLDGAPSHDWFMTKASLSRALGIRLCEDLSHQKRRCLGILVHYEDGYIEALGQVRWDQNLSSETIPIHEFKYRLHTGQRPFVTCRGRSHWTLEEQKNN
jgi:hypothetical protein